MSTSVTLGPPERVPGHTGSEPDGRPGGAYVRRLARSPALRLAGRRLLIAIPVLWGVTFLTFVVENAPELGDLTADFDFDQAPRKPFILPLHPPFS